MPSYGTQQGGPPDGLGDGLERHAEVIVQDERDRSAEVSRCSSTSSARWTLSSKVTRSAGSARAAPAGNAATTMSLESSAFPA